MNWKANKRIHSGWKDYDIGVKAGFPRTKLADEFEVRKYARGILSLPKNAAVIVASSERVHFKASSTSEGFHTSSYGDDVERQMDASSHFRLVAGPLQSLMLECVSQLQQPVAEHLGTPWRIINTRVWTTPPKAAQTGMYRFHRDGFPWALFKIMIYFTPADIPHGALEIDLNGHPFTAYDERPGSWLLFHNSTLVHRGLPGESVERACAEITLSRAREYDLMLHQPGLNAHFPLEP